MNPSMKESGDGLPLTEPIVEQASTGAGAIEAAPVAPERAPAAGQRPPAAQQPTQPAAPVMLPLPPMFTPATAQDNTSTTTQNPATAVVDDGDLIEKEWVVKAKQIVERNRDDPYRQSEELTVFRADYMKKRYDKSIKLSQ